MSSWDISIIKKLDDGYYIVMNVNGDTHCINEETLQVFVRNNRVYNYEDFCDKFVKNKSLKPVELVDKP